MFSEGFRSVNLYKLQCDSREQIYNSVFSLGFSVVLIKISTNSGGVFSVLERKWIEMVLATIEWFGTASAQVDLTPFFLCFSGRGFAFRRKQKIERQYRKLLKRGRKVHSQQDNQFTDTYPEHLKHLYLAEEEKMLKKRRRPPDDSVLSEEKLNKAVE